MAGFEVDDGDDGAAVSRGGVVPLMIFCAQWSCCSRSLGNELLAGRYEMVIVRLIFWLLQPRRPVKLTMTVQRPLRLTLNV